jgi:hypothetical protein
MNLEHYLEQRTAELTRWADIEVRTHAAREAGVVEPWGVVIVVDDCVDDIELVDAATGSAVRPSDPVRHSNNVAHKTSLCVGHKTEPTSQAVVRPGAPRSPVCRVPGRWP